METKQLLFKPSELYEQSLKNQYHAAAEQYFDALVKKSDVDVAKNRLAVKKMKQAEAKRNDLGQKLQRVNGLGIFLLVMGIIFLVLAIFGILVCLRLAGESGFVVAIILTILFLVLGIVFLVVRGTKIQKKENEAKVVYDKANQKYEEAKQEAYKTLADLNRSFDWNAPAVVMEKTTPIIDLDPYFSIERLTYLKEKFGIGEITDENYSVLDVLSGNIQGNPFVVEKLLVHTWGPKTYHGTLVIHWTTTEYDSDGRPYTQHHSETLHATVQHDAPFYSTRTLLVYGNEAAPHLTFTHYKSNANELQSEREIEKAIKEGKKQLEKISDKAVEEGRNFTPTGDDKFDVFFAANDRNNEVEFRLLFTPLAEQNIDDLLFSKPYGDDFFFKKDHMVNIIYSDHSQYFDYSADPRMFYCYDLEEGKSRFVSYCDKFISSLYFDLAPLLSIPLYQMHKPREEIYKESYPSNYTSFESECLANRMPTFLFRPNGTNTDVPVMEKVRGIDKVGRTDKVTIHSYSYATKRHVDYVEVMGGDGDVHSVPVEWIEYNRRDAARDMAIKAVGSSRRGFDDNSSLHEYLNGENPIYMRGLLGYVLNREPTEEDDKKIDSFFDNLK